MHFIKLYFIQFYFIQLYYMYTEMRLPRLLEHIKFQCREQRLHQNVFGTAALRKGYAPCWRQRKSTSEATTVTKQTI